jgi:hypothetical protein
MKLKLFFCNILIFCLNVNILAQNQNLFSNKYNKEEIAKILIPQNKWLPFPKISDREAWAKANQQYLKSYYESALKLIKYKWEAIPATTTLGYARTGNRTEYQNLSFKKREVLATLLLGEIYENKGQFTDQIINGVWSICEESYWGLPVHLALWHNNNNILPDVNDPYVDLFAAETATFLSWVDYFMGDKLDAISPVIRKRIYSETNKRIFVPVMTFEHPWMGINENGRRPNNWNPWICSNWLNTALLLEKNESRRAEMIAKILVVLDQYMNPHPFDGGCDEGPGYWNAAGASIFDNAALLNLATNNAFEYVFKDEKIRNLGSYIYRAQISEKYFLNFADANPQPNMSGGMIWRFGRAIEDKKMQEFGAWYSQTTERKLSNSQFFRVFFDLFTTSEIEKTVKQLPLPKSYWFPDLQVMVARDKEGSTDGFFVGAKGGNNDESHNHNDIGNYVVYYDGLPLLIDVGSGTYTARTFSSKRYDIWNNRSDFHNLPTINGIPQKDGAQFKASEVNYIEGNDFAQLSLNIANAYPTEAGLEKLNRTIRLNRSKNVEITDVIDSKKPQQFVEHLMTCYPVDIKPNGEIFIHYKTKKDIPVDFIVKYNHNLFLATVEKIKLDTPEDKGINNNWGETIHRVNFSVKSFNKSSKFEISISAK